MTSREITQRVFFHRYGNRDVYWVSSKIIEELRPKE